MKNSLVGICSLVAVATCTNVLQCQAQTPAPVAKENTAVDHIRATNTGTDDTYYVFNNRYAGVKGTPFLSQYWQKADLHLQGDKVMKDVPIKYDLIENHLIALRKEGDSIILAPGVVKEFVLHNMGAKSAAALADKLYRRYSFMQNSKIVDAYFEVLSESKDVALLKRVTKSLARATKEATFSPGGNNFDEIQTKAEYVVFATNGKATPVKLSRKGLDKALGEVGIVNRQPLPASTVVSTEQELVSAFQTVAAR